METLFIAMENPILMGKTKNKKELSKKYQLDTHYHIQRENMCINVCMIENGVQTNEKIE